MSWTDKNVCTLKRMWPLGYSASQIAAQLDGVVSRNAVIGKATRLGLTGNAKPSLPGARLAPKAKVGDPGRASPQRVAKRLEDARLKSVVVEPVQPAVTTTRRPEVTPTATLLTLASHACRWPIGDPAADGFGFCGRSADGVYCEVHARVAYKPRPADLKTFNGKGKLPLWARS